MATANEDLFNEAIRRQIAFDRLTRGEVRRAKGLLAASERNLIELIRKRLGDMDPAIATRDLKRLEALLREVRALRKEALKVIEEDLTTRLQVSAAVEAEKEVAGLKAAIPVVTQLVAISPEKLRAAVRSRPFQGRLLKEWFGSLSQADRRQLDQAIRLGWLEGQSVEDVVRRIRGTARELFQGGAFGATRRNAEAIVRTAFNHVANYARGEVWAANADIIAALRWTSVLDGRTSAVCRGRDGHYAPAVSGGMVPLEYRPLLRPIGARPPAHVSCRSIMVAVLDGVGLLGERPTVIDARTRRRRDIDFRKQAKEAAGGRWSAMSVQQRNAAIRGLREQWANTHIGRAPAATTYSDWLKGQTMAFQEDVLGVRKAKLFRKGKLSLNKFTDVQGKELTLEALKGKYPEAFKLAGI